MINEIIKFNGMIKDFYDELCRLEIEGAKDSDKYKTICKKIISANSFLDEEYGSLYDDEEILEELYFLVKKTNYNCFQSSFERVLSSDNIPTLGRAMSWLSKSIQYTTESFDDLIVGLGPQTLEETDGIAELDFLLSQGVEELGITEQYLYQAEAIAERLSLTDDKTIRIFLGKLDDRIIAEKDNKIKENLINFKYNFIYQNIDYEYYILGDKSFSKMVNPNYLSLSDKNKTNEIIIKTNFSTIQKLISFIIRKTKNDCTDKDAHRIILSDLYITSILENISDRNIEINSKLLELTKIFVGKFSNWKKLQKGKLLFLNKF